MIDQIIRARRSVRAFLPTPVDNEIINEILATAARAPSGANMQPWQVYVITGDKKSALTADIINSFDRPDVAEYQHYPQVWDEPYLSRRQQSGIGLYSLLGIARDDTEKKKEQRIRNFKFFDAPVGLFFTIDRNLEKGSWLDYGMFIQNILLSAQSKGIGTCVQGSFNSYYTIVARHIEMPISQQLVCGMSMGYADANRAENSLITERAEINEFVKFVR